MMRKLTVVLFLAAAAALSTLAAPRAEAQEYPNVSGLRPFSPEANYMSLPGLLRYRHVIATGRWITREQAVEAARSQGADVGPAPTG